MSDSKEYKHLKDWVSMYNDGNSIREIARQYGVTMTTVKRRIKGHIEVRPKSPYLKFADEWLALYNGGARKSDIARMYDTTPSTVGSILQKAGIKRDGNKKYLHLLDDMKNLYSSGLSLREVSEKLEVSIQLVADYLELENIDRRPYTEACRVYSIYEDYFEDVSSERKAFSLGLMWCVGNIIYDEGVARNVRLSTTQKTVVDYLMNELYGDCRISKYKDTYKAYAEDIFCEKIMMDLQNAGFSSKGNRDIPLLSNTNMVNAFLSGVFYEKITICEKNIYVKATERELSEMLVRYMVNIVDIDLDSIKKVISKKNTLDTDMFYIFKTSEVEKIRKHYKAIEACYITV